MLIVYNFLACCAGKFSIFRFQPYVNLPTSPSCSVSFEKCVVAIIFDSQESWISILSVSSLAIANSNISSPLFGVVYKALNSNSIYSINNASIFPPSVYREDFGMCGSIEIQYIYDSFDFTIIFGNSFRRGGGYGKRLFCIHMDIFNQIISTENIVCAWEEFLRGKRGK